MTPDFSNIDPDLLAFLREQFDARSTLADVPLSAALQARRKISRQAATALLTRLVQAGVLEEGEGKRPKTYRLRWYSIVLDEYPLSGLEEHVVWHEGVEPSLKQYADARALRIWSYAITEMINNAVDHSQGTKVTVQMILSAVSAICWISDDGEGIFRRIARLCSLPDERLAILELAKGKLTTDPSRHSGEGLFFTSRVMDWFNLDSFGLSFSHTDSDDGKYDDWLLESDGREPYAGTKVALKIAHIPGRSLDDVFSSFSDPEEMTFDRTHVPVKLAKMGVESLISRSQATRLLTRIDRFKYVMFDFSGVDTIGQAFADQIFRVFATDHPEVELLTTNANPQILGMISRAKRAKEERGR